MYIHQPPDWPHFKWLINKLLVETLIAAEPDAQG